MIDGKIIEPVTGYSNPTWEQLVEVYKYSSHEQGYIIGKALEQIETAKQERYEEGYKAGSTNMAKEILDELQEGYDNWESIYCVYLRLRQKYLREGE